MKPTSFRRKAIVNVSQTRWVAYATAGAATAVVGVGGTEEAVADIHYSGPINQVFNASTGNFAYAAFALAPGASFVPVHYRGSANFGAAFFAVHGAVTAGMNGFYNGAFPYVSRLTFGQNPATHPFIPGNPSGALSGYGTLAFGSGFGNSQWLTAGTGFVGFRFNTGAGVQYGWVRLTMDGAPGNSFTLVDYAWGDVGTPITAGQIPEPGSLALLALGALGLIAWRRERAKADKLA